MNSLYSIELTTIDGKTTTLAQYADKTMLIVNVASRCGFTPQYKDLELLYKDYKDKNVVVLGFPCNQFHEQEPGSNTEIALFAEQCFLVTFPLFAKIDVKGPQQAPLYAYLQQHLQKKPLKFMPWNFTKILVAPHGQVLRQFLPTTSFKTIRKALDVVA